MALFALFVGRHYGYYLMPRADQGQAFQAAGALCILALLLWWRPWWPVAAWVGWQEAMVAACAGLYIVRPLAPSEEQCSAQLGVHIGAFGAAVLLLLAINLLDRLKRLQSANPDHRSKGSP